MASTYTIQSGDTLGGIANKYGLNYKDLASWNNIADPNRIYAGKSLNLFGPSAQPAPAPVSSTITGTDIIRPNEVTPFEQVLPYGKIFDSNLINQLAQEQIKPELDRNQQRESTNMWNNMASTGVWRTGLAGQNQQNLSDAYSRALKEQTSAFTGQVNDWTSNWYDRQYENYYKNPARYVLPKLPTFDQFQNGYLSGAYDRPGSIGVPEVFGYNNPYGG